jgi:hypothetical protein
VQYATTSDRENDTVFLQKAFFFVSFLLSYISVTEVRTIHIQSLTLRVLSAYVLNLGPYISTEIDGSSGHCYGSLNRLAYMYVTVELSFECYFIRLFFFLFQYVATISLIRGHSF